MASSPLTMAMLGAGAGANSPYGMAMYDPQTMAAMQRLGFAQNLASEGLSSAPAYPMQALSRLGQAILGGYMMKQGYGDLAELGQQRQAEGAASDSFVYGPRPTPSAPAAPQSSDAPPGAGTLQSTVAASESGGRPDVVNSQGFSGKYQFGKPALISAGVYQPAEGENTSLNSDWRGTFNVAPYKPMSYDEFLKNGNAQDAAWNAHAANLDREIQTRGLDKYVGQNIGGVPITRSALIGMMQIGGPAGTQRFIESGGVYNPADANGTHISDFGKRTSGTQYAQAGNVATDASTAPAPQQPQGAPQQPASPQVGMDNPNVQHALDIQHLAATIRAAHPNPMDPMNIRAQAYEKYADHLMSIGQYKTNPNGTQINTVSGKAENAAEPLAHYVTTPTGSVDTTGTHPPTYMPSPRVYQTASGDTGAIGPGGQVTPIANNPSRITGNTPEANAARIIAEIGPRIQDGTATPQDRASYNTAAEIFQNPQVHLNPSDQTFNRIPTRAMPVGMPGSAGGSAPPQGSPQEPGSAGGKVAPGQTAAAAPPSDTGVQRLTPGGPPPAAVDKRYDDFHKLETTALGARDELQQAQLLKNTLHELGSTGPATSFLANLSRYAEQIGVPLETIKKFGLPNGADEAKAAALANSLAMEVARTAFPQRITNTDLRTAQSIKPNPNNPMAANDYLLDNTIIPKAQRDVDRYGSVVNLTNSKHPDYDASLGSLNAKLYEFDQAHPLSSYTPGFQPKPTQGGAAPAPQAGQQPQQPSQEAPPMEGARKAPDGNWYVSDPKRPGKYMMVR